MPEESPLLFCDRHPTVETGLRCSRCERPICPRCLVQTPVGARCVECARLRKLPMFEVGPTHLARSAGAGVAAGALGGLVLPFVPTFGLFGTLLIGAVLGLFVGAAVEQAANRKRGTPLMVVAAAASVVGPMLGLSILVFFRLPSTLPMVTRLARALTGGIEAGLGLLLLLAVAAVVAASRVR